MLVCFKTPVSSRRFNPSRLPIDEDGFCFFSGIEPLIMFAFDFGGFFQAILRCIQHPFWFVTFFAQRKRVPWDGDPGRAKSQEAANLKNDESHASAIWLDQHLFNFIEVLIL